VAAVRRTLESAMGVDFLFYGYDKFRDPTFAANDRLRQLIEQQVQGRPHCDQDLP
jgi:hypothetical protein